jgi:hypothetical protein
LALDFRSANLFHSRSPFPRLRRIFGSVSHPVRRPAFSSHLDDSATFPYFLNNAERLATFAQLLCSSDSVLATMRFSGTHHV